MKIKRTKLVLREWDAGVKTLEIWVYGRKNFFLPHGESYSAIDLSRAWDRARRLVGGSICETTDSGTKWPKNCKVIGEFS
jgi:hypothetical protein